MSRLELCAEISANHLGSLDRALAIVDAAADAGADLLKVQTWTPGTMCISRECTLNHGPWAGRKLCDLYEEAFTPWEWHAPIFKRALARGMEPFGAAFDNGAVDFLCSLGVKRLKVASFELVDLPLIRYMASKRKPMILSTGMADEDEVQRAFWLAREGADEVTVLHCVSAYPADPASFDLRGMRGVFGGPFGLSDHSKGIGVAVAAAALGASYIEKHLTIRREDRGLDAGFSMEPAEFAAMVTACRQAHAAVQPRTGPTVEDRSLRRSLWVVKPTQAGQSWVLGDNVRTARPAHGLPCATDLNGKVAAFDVPAGSALAADMLK
jgi:N-acetylneuraminate synthase